MGDVRRMRGRSDEIVTRARAVVAGHTVSERNPVVLTLAADLILEPYLKAAHSNDKGDILSFRQILRRKSREVYLGDGLDSIDLKKFAANPRWKHGTIHRLDYDESGRCDV